MICIVLVWYWRCMLLVLIDLAGINWVDCSQFNFYSQNKLQLLLLFNIETSAYYSKLKSLYDVT